MTQEVPVPARKLINKATGLEIAVELITSVNIGGTEIELKKPVLGNMSVMRQLEIQEAEKAAGESESESNLGDTGGDEGI